MGAAPTTKRTLRIGTVEVSPFTMRRLQCHDANEANNECRGSSAFDGYAIDLVKLLARHLNATYAIEIGQRTGNRHPNGSWDGLVGDLISSTIDIAVGPIVITPERSSVVDFSPFLANGFSVMIKKPKCVSCQKTSSPNPFTSATWATIAILQIISVATVVVLWTRRNKSKVDLAKGPESRVCLSLCIVLVWLACSLYLLGTAFLHAYVCTSTGRRSDIMCGTPEVTQEEMRQGGYFDSVEEMMNHTDIEYGVQQGGMAHLFLKNSANLLHREIYKRMEQSNGSSFVSTYGEGIERVRKGSFAFILDDAANQYINSRRPCDTMKIGANLNTFHYGVATSKGSHLTEQVRIAIESMKISGELESIRHRWFVDRSQCSIPDGKTTLTVYEMAFAQRTAPIALRGLGLSLFITIVLTLLVALMETKCAQEFCKGTYGPPIEESDPMAAEE